LLWRPAQESNLGILAIWTTRPWPNNYRFTLQSNKHLINFKFLTVFYTCTRPGFALVRHKLTTTNLQKLKSTRCTYTHTHTHMYVYIYIYIYLIGVGLLRLQHPLPSSTSRPVIRDWSSTTRFDVKGYLRLHLHS
jgi:hypothetical protein